MTTLNKKLNFKKGLLLSQVLFLASFSLLVLAGPVTVYAGRKINSNFTFNKIHPITPPNKPSRPVTPPDKEKPVPPKRPVTPPVKAGHYR